MKGEEDIRSNEHTWTMKMTMRWTRQKVEPQCANIQTRKQSRDDDTFWQTRKRDYENEGYLILLGFALCYVSSFFIFVGVTTTQFCFVRKFLVQFTCENGSLDVLSLQFPVSCGRSNYNIFWIFLQVVRLGFSKGRQTTGFTIQSYCFACILIYRFS